MFSVNTKTVSMMCYSYYTSLCNESKVQTRPAGRLTPSVVCLFSCQNMLNSYRSNATLKVVPLPSSDSTVIVPLCRSTILRHMDNPNPCLSLWSCRTVRIASPGLLVGYLSPYLVHRVLLYHSQPVSPGLIPLLTHGFHPIASQIKHNLLDLFGIQM